MLNASESTLMTVSTVFEAIKEYSPVLHPRSTSDFGEEFLNSVQEKNVFCHGHLFGNNACNHSMLT